MFWLFKKKKEEPIVIHDTPVVEHVMVWDVKIPTFRDVPYIHLEKFRDYLKANWILCYENNDYSAWKKLMTMAWDITKIVDLIKSED